jgi:hypothetical protein
MEDIIDAKKNAEWSVWADKNDKKLHVHGVIYVQDKGLVYELGKKTQGYLKDELMLEITPKLSPGQDKVTIKYHEDLSAGNQYSRVTISSGAEEVASIVVKEQ